MEEGILHIELQNGPVTGDSSGKHRANSGQFYNWAKSLIIADSRALSETLKDPTCLVAIKGPVSTELVREDPHANDNIGALRSGNQLAGPIVDQGSILFLHSRMPMGIGSDSLCAWYSSPGRHTRWNVGRAFVAWWQSC
jgi:hypothetical protein